MVWKTTIKRGGLGHGKIIAEPLVCYFSIVPYPVSDTGECSVLNAGDGHYQGGQSRNPSRAFLCLIVFRRLMSSRTDMHLPNSPSRDYLAQYNQSGAGINPHVEDRAGSRYELSNMGDGALSRRTSKRNNPGVNAGYTTRNISRQYYASPDLDFILNSSSIRS